MIGFIRAASAELRRAPIALDDVAAKKHQRTPQMSKPIDREKYQVFLAKCAKRIGREFSVQDRVDAFTVLMWIKEYLDSGALDKEDITKES